MNCAEYRIEGWYETKISPKVTLLRNLQKTELFVSSTRFTSKQYSQLIDILESKLSADPQRSPLSF